MVTLQKMSQSEFTDYMQSGAVERLAKELAKSRDLTMDAALKASAESFEKLWPGGRIDTDPDMRNFTIQAEGRNVGRLMMSVRRDQGTPYAYVWELEISKEARGRGYAALAMSVMESEAAQMGVDRIALNVFGDNAPAIGLYKKLGYVNASISMKKYIKEKV